jgi:hypothetical protein
VLLDLPARVAETVRDFSAQSSAFADSRRAARDSSAGALTAASVEIEKASAPGESIQLGILRRRPEGSTTVTAPPGHRGAQATLRSRPWRGWKG